MTDKKTYLLMEDLNTSGGRLSWVGFVKGIDEKAAVKRYCAETGASEGGVFAVVDFANIVMVEATPDVKVATLPVVDPLVDEDNVPA